MGAFRLRFQGVAHYDGRLFNSYLKRLVRLQTAWERPRVEAADPDAPLADEHVPITRFQVAF